MVQKSISSSNRIFWYIRRLARMDVHELVHRLKELVWISIDYVYFNYIVNAKNSKKVYIDAPALAEFLRNYQNEIEQELPYGAYSGRHVPEPRFYKFLKLSQIELRQHWETQRFNDLVHLALIGDQHGVLTTLKRFSVDHPVLQSEAYVSTMECAIRVINLFAALNLLKKEGGISKELEMVSRHFFRVNRNLINHRISQYSSRGNHTLFEYAGLIVAFRALGQTSKSQRASCLFWKEFDAQVANDGSGIEQSTAYHAFNMDITILVQEFLCSNDDLEHKRAKGLSFTRDFMTDEGAVVRFGDSDNSVLFTRPIIAETKKCNVVDFTRVYSTGGFAVIRRGRWRILVKFGHLGNPPLFAHAHYDFLSVCILLDGVLYNLDSTTYLYRNPVRSQVRSSEYHSMPTAGEDDLVQLSEFMWDKSAAGSLDVQDTSGDIWDFAFSYLRSDGVELKRKISLSNNVLRFVDSCVSPHNTPLVHQVRWLFSKSSSPNYEIYLSDGKTRTREASLKHLTLAYSHIYGRVDPNGAYIVDAKSLHGLPICTEFRS